MLINFFHNKMSTTAACCSNHTCAKSIDAEHDNHVLCSLCRDAMYCSEECRMIDWPVHDCPNAVRVPAIGTILATPYFYQDEIATADLEAELSNPASPLNTSYLLHHVGTDMKVSQRIVPVGESAKFTKNPLRSFGRGTKPDDQMMNKEFRVELYQGNAQGPLIWDSDWQKLGDRAIYKGSDNETANAIAQTWSTAETKSNSLLLWPFMTGIPKMDTRGNVYARITIDGYQPLELDFYYPTIKTNFWMRTAAQLGKYIRRRMLLKFPRENIDKLKFYQTLRAETSDGVGLYLTISLDSNTQTKMVLKDVEVLIREDQLTPDGNPPRTQKEKIVDNALSKEDVDKLKKTIVDVDSIYCDASKLEHMTGLTMALEFAATQIKADAIAAPSNMAAFEEAAAIVRKHTRDMIEGRFNPEEKDTPMQVNAAVYTAVNALQEMQAIEISISKDNVKKYGDKLARAGRPPQADALGVQEITPIVEELEKIRAASTGKQNFFKKRFATAKKSRLEKQLNDWKIALETYLNTQPEGTTLPLSYALITRGKSGLVKQA